MSDPRPLSPTLPLEAAAWLDALPGAVLVLDAVDRIRWANATAQAWLAGGVVPGAALRDAIGPVADARPGAPQQLPGGRWVTARRSAGPGGAVLLVLDDAQALVAERDARGEDRDMLSLAQHVGRLGLWQRDVRTLQGRWTPQVHRFWGQDAGTPTPDFDAAAEQILDGDRESIQTAFRASLQRPGVYAHRYRVRRPDGSIAHLHSHWLVRNGADGQAEQAFGILVDDTEVLNLVRERDEVQSQLALASELGGLLLFRHDLRRGRHHFSPQAWRFLGHAPAADGLAPDVMRARIHPDDVDAARHASEAALRSTEPVDLDLRMRDAEGRWRDVMTRRVALRDATGQAESILVVALDVTERRAEEQRTRGLSARFDLAVRTAGIGYWSREGDAERADWNHQMRALHGLAAGAPVPTLKEWRETFVHPEDRAFVGQEFREWLSGRAPQVQSELRIVRTDGRVRHLMTHSLLESGGPTPVHFGIVIDVTERRLADQALRRADERAALAARGAGIGTWELDRRSGDVHWDEQMWRLRGCEPLPTAPTAEEMLRFVHPEDVVAARRYTARASRADEVVEYQFRVRWPDGSVRWLASRSVTVRDAQGLVDRRIGVNWDVTAARQAEAERREREAAEQANVAKSRFLARMSHELRTPLNAVLGFTQLLLARAPGDTERDWLTHVESAGRHLLSLINDVLDLASLDTGELRITPVDVDLRALIAETLPLLEPLRAELDVDIRLEVAPLQLWTDPVRLRQVLINLLSNALKYNRAQGRVSVSARAEGGLAVVAVQDTGRGMSDAQLRRLYAPFDRLGIEGEGIEGTGIGLTIVKALVDRMGGTITVSSQPAQGTCFELRLPLAGAMADPAPAPAVAPLSPARGLLYVEDNPVNALIVQALLQRRPDIRCLQAADGRSGLALARAQRPGLVLLDMQLPDLDGLAVLQALRADPATADIPVIAVSANVLEIEVARARAAGVIDYWGKPIDVAAFARAVDRLFGPPAAGI